MLHCDNGVEMEVTETRMELIILSTLATVAILAAELQDLARGAVEAWAARTVGQHRGAVASVAALATRGRGAPAQAAAARAEFDRAA
jgi:hypothetical protein